MGKTDHSKHPSQTSSGILRRLDGTNPMLGDEIQL